MASGFVNVSFTQFFDRGGILDRMTKKERRVLSGTGAFGRTAVRRSIRKAPKKARKTTAGRPPFFHVRGRESLKDRIFFGFDAVTASVIVGPEKFNGKGRARLLGARTVPELLEKGGRRIVEVRRKRSGTVSVSQKYEPRPFVGSGTAAFKATQQKMAELMGSIQL